MDEIFLKCRQLLLDNIKSKLSDEAIDLLSVSVLALYLNDGEMILERMPKIIRNLDLINIDDRTVFEMVKDIDKKVTCEEYKNTVGANITFFNSNGIVETLLVSLSQRDSKLAIIDTMVHELTHLLRKGTTLSGADWMVFYEGISVRHWDLLYKSVSRVNVWFEDAIVEHHAKEAISTLVEFLKDAKEDSICNTVLDGKDQAYRDVEPAFYPFFNKTLDILCEDDEFKEGLAETFRTPGRLGDKMIRRFNMVLGDDNAFTRYSYWFDQLGETFATGDDSQREKICDEIAEMTKEFYFRSMANEKRGIKRPGEKVQ